MPAYLLDETREILQNHAGDNVRARLLRRTSNEDERVYAMSVEKLQGAIRAGQNSAFDATFVGRYHCRRFGQIRARQNVLIYDILYYFSARGTQDGFGNSRLRPRE